MDQPSADSMLRELDRFVGEWTMTAGPPGGPPWPGEARVRFEWVDRAFLAQRLTVARYSGNRDPARSWLRLFHGAEPPGRSHR